MAKVSYNKLKYYDNDLKTTVIADKYDSTKTYKVNDYCVYSSVDNTNNGGSLYRCIVAITTAEAWTAAHWAKVNIGDDLGPLSRRIDQVTNGDTTTVTGNPIEITDSIEGMPVKDLQIAFSPKQDLHGYANPWPEGGGKNKLPLTVSHIKSLNVSVSWNGNTYVYHNLTFKILVDDRNVVTGIEVTGTANAYTSFYLAEVTLPTGTYILNGKNGLYQWDFTVQSGSAIPNSTADSYQFTVSETTTVAVKLAIGSGHASNKIATPMLRDSSVTDATFAPYSNICPITGWESLNLWKVSEKGNLFPSDSWLNQGSGTIDRVNRTITSGDSYDTLPYLGTLSGTYKPYTSYTFVFTGTSSNENGYLGYRINYTDGTNSGILSGFSTKKKTIVYVSDSSKTVGGAERMTQSGTKVFYADGCGIFEGASPRGYSSVSFPFSTTQYGGTIDVLRGKATITYASFTVGDLTWTESTLQVVRMVANYPGLRHGNNSYVTTGISSQYKASYVNALYQVSANNCFGVDSNSYVYVYDSRYTDAATFKSSEASVRFAIPLETPIEISLTPAEISLLAGYNYIYSDSNGNITMEYGEAIGSLMAAIDRLTARVAALENA